MTEKRTDTSLFKERLRQVISERHLTQQQVADSLKITQKTISLWCSGKGLPDSTNMKVLTSFFDVSQEWLMGKTDYKNEKEIINAWLESAKNVTDMMISGKEMQDGRIPLSLGQRINLFAQNIARPHFEQIVRDSLLEQLHLSEKEEENTVDFLCEDLYRILLSIANNPRRRKQQKIQP